MGSLPPPLDSLTAPKPSRPADLKPEFVRAATALLSACELVVAETGVRLLEVEAYYSAPGHPDPYTHRDPLQRQPVRWYFHRCHGHYRGGTFKGLDLTLGDGSAYYGLLLRAIRLADGSVVDGPCRVVEYLLARSGFGSVAELDAAIAGRTATDPSSPLCLRPAAAPCVDPLYATARVGLSWDKARTDPIAWAYVGRRYRFLTEPRAIRPGKPQTVVALYEQGEPVGLIAARTGCPPRVVERYVAAYEAGRAVGDRVRVEPVRREPMTGADLCLLLGAWAAGQH